jgi:hypothetical protein
VHSSGSSMAVLRLRLMLANPWTLLSEAALLAVCVGSDRLARLVPPDTSRGLLRRVLPLLLDNLAHALIALLTWSTAVSLDVR